MLENKYGRDEVRANIKVRGKAGLDLETQHEDSLAKIRTLEQPTKRPKLEEEVPLEKPQFIRPLNNAAAKEGMPIHLEATVIPIHDPNLKVFV